MRKILLGLSLAAFATVPASAALKEGAKAPDFTTTGAVGGKAFKLHLADQLKKGPVVLYFFPKAFTSGCTAEAHAFSGNCDMARRELPGALGLRRDTFTMQRAARALAFCGDGAEATTLINELMRRFPDATLTARLQAPLVAAAAALANGQPRRTLQLLESVAPYDQVPSAELWPPDLRGQAELSLNEPRAARGQFQSIVDHRGLAPTSPLYPLAYLGIGRAAARQDDRANAKAAYDRLFSLWEHADPGLTSLDQARREYSELK